MLLVVRAYLQPDNKCSAAEGLVCVSGSCYASDLGHLGWTTLAGCCISTPSPPHVQHRCHRVCEGAWQRIAASLLESACISTCMASPSVPLLHRPLPHHIRGGCAGGSEHGSAGPSAPLSRSASANGHEELVLTVRRRTQDPAGPQESPTVDDANLEATVLDTLTGTALTCAHSSALMPARAVSGVACALLK